MKRLKAALLCLLVTVSFSADALESDKRKAVDELMGILNIAQLTELMARNMTYTMVQAITSKYGKLDQAVADIIYQEARVIMHEQYTLNGKLSDIFYKLYDEYYSAEELQTIVAFYKSPAGQRMLEVGDKISARSMEEAQKHAASFGSMAQERIQKKLKQASDALEEAEAQYEAAAFKKNGSKLSP